MENEYLKVMILPELGGRIQMAYDKIKQRHFVYFNHVVKPALVGLAGPWISGGIEFNWPQHHRPSTFLPTDCTIEEGDNGEVTVWVSETEKMFRQKGMAGFVLRPGCSYLEIKGVVYNRTDVPQTFLWWANPAVEVNDEYQSVFPPDVNAVFDHGKRAVSSFPIATGTYYKIDYSAGVDISNYRNIPVPTSYMAVNSRFDFEGGYENDTQAGMLHVASHHFSPGKKQWTWGNGDFGRAWDRNLTDEATPQECERWHLDRKGVRPYIELMAGVYTENQPDFAWLMPYEEKSFVQYFMPYRELGVVKEATKDLLMNINETGKGHVTLKLFVTSRQHLYISLKTDSGEKLFENECDLSPEEVMTKEIETNETDFSQLNLYIYKQLYGEKHQVVYWHAEPDDIKPIPDSAEPALLPEQLKTNEQLFLTGQHLEQYRHATWNPLNYYEEALRRDPNDIRCLNAMGLWYIRKGRFARAEQFLRKAMKLSQKRNPNPYDGEPIYNLALSLKYQEKTNEAYELFWKATWNKAWADAAYFEAAKISVSQHRLDDALDELNRSLTFGAHNQKALALKATVLRKMNLKKEALKVCDHALKTDLFNYACRYEQYLLTGNEALLEDLKKLLQKQSNNYDELALDYSAAGLHDEAHNIWNLAIKEKSAGPMTYYYLKRYDEAENADPRYCFPNKAEDIITLETAKRNYPQGAKAPYYLGCLYYAARQYDLAIENWELSAKTDPSFPTVWRNLALARFNKQNLRDEALEYMKRAFQLDKTDPRVFMELDQLYKRLQKPHQERLSLLKQYPHLVAQRDDLVLEEITLLNQTKCHKEAMQLLDSHHFHPWEGGEGKVSEQYRICRVELAKKAMREKQFDIAVSLLKQCLEYPPHLGEGKLRGAQENDFHYLLGCCCEADGKTQQARLYWEQAAKGPQEPAAAMYYNDAKPDKIFYQGLSLLKLGQTDKANGRFNKLIAYGKQHLFEKQTMDYFAVSLPDLLIWEDSLDRKNEIHCKYMLALGYWGLGNRDKSMRYIKDVSKLDINHQGIEALKSLAETKITTIEF